MNIIKRWGGPKGWRELLPDHSGAFRQIFSSLRNKNFRTYFAGQSISLVGTWMQQVAMSWLAYRLTGSVFVLAAITFMEQMPILVLTPFSGTLIDRFDQRKILLITQTLSAIQALVLSALVLFQYIEIWHLMVLSVVVGCINAVDHPARQAFYPTLVSPDKLGNAIAINASVFNASRLIGPAIGGFVIALVGEGICFLFNMCSYIAMIVALVMLHVPKYQLVRKKAPLLKEMKEGFMYVTQSLPIRALLLFMSAISFFGIPILTFIPAYAKSFLHGESELLGLLMSSVGLGSFAAAICLAARKRVVGLGKVVMFCGILLGLSLIGLAFNRLVWLALVLCVPVGFAIIGAAAANNTLIQTLSDEDKRGRVMGYHSMSFLGVPPLGCIFFGQLENYLGLSNVLVICGIGCVLSAVVFEYYRPRVRNAARPVFVEKGIIPEIAVSLDNSRPRVW